MAEQATAPEAWTPKPTPGAPDDFAPTLIKELDKQETLAGWGVLVRFGLDKLLDNDPALLLEILIRRAYREPPDGVLVQKSKGERFATILEMFDLKVSLNRKRASKS